jgi:type 1 glutamine amidotransferase
MKLLRSLVLSLALAAFASAEDQWITYEGKDGPGKGKRIVLLAGDEEYRSEEALPMLAKILSQRHGFTATVLFAINKATGEIDPNTPDNLPGAEALDKADLVITSLRFRRWPDEQFRHFADYVKAGKPLIGLRTSTHSFSGIKGDFAPFNAYGKKVLGEGWVSHWGKHKSEATRGIIQSAAKDNVLLRGVSDIFGDTDVYEAYPSDDAKVLVRGTVLQGMKPGDAPADYKKKRATDKQEQGVNDPAMAVVWTRSNENEFGKGNQILCTTMGSATDLQNEGLRRLLVNAAYSFTGLEVPAKADVAYVDPYQPLFYGFNGFRKGLKVSDQALGKTLPELPLANEKKK